MSIDDKYWPRDFLLDEPGTEPVSLINQPIAPENVGVLVPGRQR